MLRDGIAALAPALIAFQEAIVTDGYDQVVDLAGAGCGLAADLGRQPVAGVWASDHFEVLADLALPSPRAETPA